MVMGTLMESFLMIIVLIKSRVVRVDLGLCAYVFIDLLGSVEAVRKGFVLLSCLC